MSCDIDNATSAMRTQEFRKNFSNNWQAGCGNLIWSATATDPTQRSAVIRFREWDKRQLGINTMNANKAPKVSKLRMAAGVGLATVGLSLIGSLVPAVASADPWVPHSGPLHPIRHYAADALHPIFTITHPIRSLVP
jgi:hypothetical protein